MWRKDAKLRHRDNRASCWSTWQRHFSLLPPYVCIVFTITISSTRCHFSFRPFVSFRRYINNLDRDIALSNYSWQIFNCRALHQIYYSFDDTFSSSRFRFDRADKKISSDLWRRLESLVPVGNGLLLSSMHRTFYRDLKVCRSMMRRGNNGNEHDYSGKVEIFVREEKEGMRREIVGRSNGAASTGLRDRGAFKSNWNPLDVRFALPSVTRYQFGGEIGARWNETVASGNNCNYRLKFKTWWFMR